MKDKEFKKGDKVEIVTTGEKGKVVGLFSNGAMIKKDSNVTRKFTTVKFKNLKRLRKTRSYIKH